MGMYTELYFRANIKEGPVADWLDSNINGEDDWTPQYSYWKRPEKMDDGGKNVQ